MSIDEIFDSVVPLKSGYVQGLGPGPKPISRELKMSEQRRKDAEERARAAEEQNEELKKQIEELRTRQDGIEESIFQRIRADVDLHFRQSRLNMDTPSWMHGETSNNGEYKNINMFNIVKVHNKN